MPKSRTLLTVAMTSMALIMVAGPAAAHKGDGDTHRGKVGRHAFPDSDKNPGARCIYRLPETDTSADVSDAVPELTGVTVRPPKVAAINRTKRVDRQPVAWRFILQEKADGGEWTNVKRSRLQVKRASDRWAAKFTRLGVRYDGNPEADYRVKTRAYWLSKRNQLKKVGVATHLVDHYRVRGTINEGSCSGAYVAPEAP